MRFHPILFQKSRFISMILLCVLFTGAIHAQKNIGEKIKAIDVNLKVVDENGNPVPKAQVVLGEGVKHIETDENGVLSFKAFPYDFVTVSLPGYEKTVSLVEQILIDNTVKLVKSKLYLTTDDDIPLPFITLKKRHITGSEQVLMGSQLEKYPSTDLRNALTGLGNNLEVLELNGSTGMSMEEKLGVYGVTQKVKLSARGQQPIFIIDDMPIDITEIQLDPQEIESVTIIKDIVAKAMYGPMAANGAIFIRTKHGTKNERILNVNFEDGISVIDRFPKWTSGADYARLNNQARTNSSLLQLYSNDDITAYAKNDPYDMYHPSVNFREMILKNTKSFTRANVSSQGGNDVVQYYANVGYDGDGDIYKIGSISDFNRISSRANLDIKITDFFNVQFGIYGELSMRRSPNYGYSSGEGSGAMDIIEFDRVVDDVTSISPIAFPVYANNSPSLKTPWYGVNLPTFPNNPIGSMIQNGYYNETGRVGNTNLILNFVPKRIKGLKSKTYFGFNPSNLVRIGKSTDYIAYNVVQSATASGADTILLFKSHDGIDMAGQANLHDYYYQRLGVFENLSYDKSIGNHNVQTTLTYYLSKVSRDRIKEPERQQNAIWSVLYSYNDKYSIQCVLNYAGTYWLDKGNRYELFPSAGASWVVSEEKFMSNLKFINYLKLRTEIGILGNENFMQPYYYRDNFVYSTGNQFGPAPAGYWFGSTAYTSPPITTPNRIGNPDLTWEKRKEFIIGLDVLMFNQKLTFEVNYYNNISEGIISQRTNTLPYSVGISDSRPWYNYNKFRYYGMETVIQYTDKIGNFRYSLSGNATLQNSKILQYDEPDYRFSYQSMIGKPISALFGQTYIGKFSSDAEASVVPQRYDEILHAGDLKYADINGDGIVDDNDNSMIGNTTPRLYYAINALFSFKNFDLTVIGTGRAFYDIALTNRYYWNGFGDGNYSDFVKNNIDGAYPNLTYYKVNNNFVNSNFWLTGGGYFKIQNIELAYNVPAKIANTLTARGFRIFVRGANLFTISRIKDVDPESIDSGVEAYPLFKTFTGGIKLTF